MDDARGDLERRWTQLGLQAEDLEPRSNGTIAERPLRANGDAPIYVADTVLAGAPQPTTSPLAVALPSRIGPTPSLMMPAVEPEAIVLGPALGGGGMGIVHLAEQPSLRREVAVKVLRPERRASGSVSALLREAWVMGTLEHPSIVPVHLLLREEDGCPRVVMKRIEGVAWDALIDNPDLARELGGGSDVAKDPLEYHLRVLIAVCHAVAFAHSRGILHLDLKPDNVMIGRFGEVSVLDWGIAASHGEAGPRWLPDARQIRGVRGTPAWMAPELASADGERIGPTTDVYLLGGILHAILTGGVRHDGATVRDILHAAFESAPVAYGPKVPIELAALANRATAREPADRPQSAEAFRRELESFLAHRASTILSDEAHRNLGPLVARLADTEEADPRKTGAHVRTADSIRRAFLECQYAYRQALQIWPDNPTAKADLRVLLRAMAEHALRNRQLERAAECLHAMEPSDPELSRRLSDLAREAIEDQQRLRALERDADPNVNYRERRVMALAVGVAFVLWNLLSGWLHRSGTYVFDLERLVVGNVASCGVFALAAFAVRRSMLVTAANRRLVVLFGSGFGTVLVFWAAALELTRLHPDVQLGVLDVVALTNWVYVYFVLALTFTMDPRVAWLALPSVAVAAIAPYHRELAFEMLGLGGFVCGFGLFVIWRTPWRGRRAVR